MVLEKKGTEEGAFGRVWKAALASFSGHPELWVLLQMTRLGPVSVTGDPSLELSFNYSLAWFPEFVKKRKMMTKRKPKALTAGHRSTMEASGGDGGAKSVSGLFMVGDPAPQPRPHYLPFSCSPLYR